MANSMNKSAAVITGAGANSIIRAAKTMLSSHYSHEPLHVKICVQTGAPLHVIYSESRGFKQGGKRVITVKIASKLVGGAGGGARPGITEEVRRPLVWPDSYVPCLASGSLRRQRTSSVSRTCVAEEPSFTAPRRRLSIGGGG